MPGIAGFIATDRTASPADTVERMTRAMVHEPWHTSGTLVESQLGVGVGWVAHEGSSAAAMPVASAQGELSLVLAGELTATAEALPDWLASHRDGPLGSFAKLNGTFSGVLIDRRAGRVFLFNDRYGLNRVYHHENPRGFFFASEAKALLTVCPELRQLDERGMAEFLVCGCPLQGRTLFAGVSLLPGASCWRWEVGGPAVRESYFVPQAWEQQPELSWQDYDRRMDETFTRILPAYCSSGGRVSLSLTGGLDSRMIIAGLNPAPGSLPCHSFGGMYRECADVRLARQIASVCRQQHDIISLGKDFFEQFDRLAGRTVYLSDGAMDVSGSVELYMNRLVRQNADVRLTGNYGSEVLRGTVAFKPVVPAVMAFESGFAARFTEAAATYRSERAVAPLSFIAFKQMPWFHHARFSVEQSQLTVRSPYLDDDVVQLAFQAPRNAEANRLVAHRYIARHNRKLADIPTDRGVRPAVPGAGRGGLARFQQEFMPRMEYAWDYGMPSWLARLAPVWEPMGVDRWFLGRQKFYHYRSWYRGPLARYVREVLLDGRSLARPYLNRRGIERIVNGHTSGRANFTLEIHKLLTTELIQRQLIGLTQQEAEHG